jgi:hypothetical protein
VIDKSVMLAQRGVAAAVKEERTTVGGGSARHSSYDDGVIAGRILGLPYALDVGQRSIQQDQTFRAQPISNAVKAILVLVGEPPGKGLLRTGEDVYHEFAGSKDGIVHLGFAVHANRNQRGPQ